MKIYIGADHRGFELKAKVQELLADRQIACEDLGVYTHDSEDDFNEPAIAVAKAVLGDAGSRGILICGASHGVCMQANRFRGIRAISGITAELTHSARAHNDANILCLNADSNENHERIIDTFLNTDFLADEKYIRRNKKLDEVDL